MSPLIQRVLAAGLATAALGLPACGRRPSGDGSPASSSTLTAAGPVTYREYANPRYGFVVEYPEAFQPVPPTDEGTREWTWGNLARMTVWGHEHVATDSMEEFCKSSASRHRVTPRTLTPTSCLVTGSMAGKVFWEKTLVSENVLYGVRFEYDESAKAYVEPLINYVEGTLRRP